MYIMGRDGIRSSLFVRMYGLFGDRYAYKRDRERRGYKYEKNGIRRAAGKDDMQCLW